MVVLAYIPGVQREVIGQSHTWYRFDPTARVEDDDVDLFLSKKIRLGCACQGNSREVPMFVRLEDVRSGKVIPEWPDGLLKKIKDS